MNSSNNQLTTSYPNVLSLVDFCKGLAIAWVFLFHYSKTWFGWQGVHIFIVLSGFGLTYSCLNKQNILWRHWYVRRAERILPVYWLVLVLGFFFLIYINLRKETVNFNFGESLFKLALDLSFLRNFSYQTIFNYPNDQLWFVPLIVSFYIVFPLLYKLLTKFKTTQSCLLILIAAVVVEFGYRAISVYLLDGLPVGFQTRFWGDFPNLLLEPIDKISNYFLFPFQREAPFGLFPARIAEFMLGMVGAILLVENDRHFNKVFSNSICLLGVAIWLAGCALVYVGLWGWIFASFLIALGLALWTINLALLLQQNFFYLFLRISQLGSWSYYIFLTHSVFIHIFEFKAFTNLEAAATGGSLPTLLLFEIFKFVFIVFGTATFSWLVMKFDRSKLPKMMIKKSIAYF